MEGTHATIGVLEHKSQIIRLEPTKELKHVRAENLRKDSIELDGKNYKRVMFSHFSDENLFRYKFDGKAFVDATVYESEGIIADIKISKEQSGNDDGTAKEHAVKQEAPASKPASVKSETPKGEIRNLSNVTITSVSLKSVSLDENEYFFSKHTEKTFEPAVGMVVDAVVYETASGRLYLNGIAPVKGAEKNSSGSSESGKEQKNYSNNHRLFGYIEMVTEKAIKVANQWFNLTEKSYVDEKTVMDKGEYVAIYFYASPKSGNFINKLYPATDKYSKKSA
jgi:hypothetical protein